MFNHFLDTRQTHRDDAIDKCSITYLGESFPLALVPEDLREGGRTRLHHPGPPLESPDVLEQNGGAPAHPPHLLQEDLSFLESKHVFEFPERAAFDALIDVFLNTFLPLYSLVNRQEFIEQYQHERLPWILVHSCCFVSTTFCAESLLHKLGYTSRKEARYAFYSKAKALFDAGYERNKIVVLQSTIMLTFWGGGPNDYWNTWSWVSTAVTIAETLGIHRSTSATNMSPKDRSLLKRLWWTLVVRDASSATLVGRPFRINMEHGDAEMLTLQDFKHEIQSLELVGHSLARTFAHYQVEVTKLSLLLYDIDYARFIPGPKALSMPEVYGRLQAWKNSLPPEVDWDQDPNRGNLLATCLSMVYDHHLMLASIGIASSAIATSNGDGDVNPDGSMTTVQQPFAELAAQRVSSQASAIVMKSQSLLVPHETYQAVFLAGVVSYTSMRSSQTMLAQVGRLVVDNCRMVLHNVRDAWDAAPWIIILFDGLTNSLNALPRQESSAQTPAVPGRTPIFSMVDFDEILRRYTKSLVCHLRCGELVLRTPDDKAYCVYLSVIPDPQCARIEIELCIIPALEQQDTDPIYYERHAEERMTASSLAQEDIGPVYMRRPFDSQARPAKNDPPTGCHNFSRLLYAVQIRPVKEAEAAVSRLPKLDVPKGQVVFSWKGTAFLKLAINRPATGIAAAAARTFRAIFQAMKSGAELHVVSVPHKNGGGLRILDMYWLHFARLSSPSPPAVLCAQQGGL
ncbi:hypothetical protein LTR33_014626 [Friedmanniomyces endolithicus]|nr:hypothetical protein LTR33_014626 [Friedmanniomyces endolithicus]